LGDKFLGIRGPVLRKLAKKYRDISIDEAYHLLRSKLHEERLTSLFLLIDMFQKAKDQKDKRAICLLYLENTRYVNNWDLVDCSAEHLVCAYLRQADKQPIYELVSSPGFAGCMQGRKVRFFTTEERVLEWRSTVTTCQYSGKKSIFRANTSFLLRSM